MEHFRAASTTGNTAEAVRGFLASGVPEGTYLDYKWKVDLSSRKGKGELRKWVAGLANSRGGLLVFGVAEHEERKGEPDRERPFKPVIVPNGVELAQHVTNILVSGIVPRLWFEVFPFDAESGGQCCIIVVPQSTERPHVVDGQGIPVRRGTSTTHATRDEIDQMYAHKVVTHERLEGMAIEVTDNHCPPQIHRRPHSYVYLTPAYPQYGCTTLDKLMNGPAYRNREKGVPNWPRRSGGVRLPEPEEWRGHSAGAAFQIVDKRTGGLLFYAVAFENGSLATWTELTGRNESCLDPFMFMAGLHGSIEPWVTSLSNLGLLVQLKGALWLRNVVGMRADVRNWVAPLHSDQRILTEPRPHVFDMNTTMTLAGIRDVCWRLWERLFVSSGLKASPPALRKATAQQIFGLSHSP